MDRPSAPPVPVADLDSRPGSDHVMRLLHEIIQPEWIEDLFPSAPQTVFTGYVVLWMLIYQRLHQNASLASALSMFLQDMAQLSTSKRVQDQTLSARTGGFSRARQRFPVTLANRIADHVFHSFLPPTSRQLPGRRVFLVDGTSVPLTPRRELQKRWPVGRPDSAWPICRLAVLHELDTGMMLRPEAGAMYGEEAVSEVTLAESFLQRLPAQSVLMADRGFGVFSFTFAATQAGHDVLLRLSWDRFRSLQKKATPVRPGVWELVWKPTIHNRRSFPHLPADAQITVTLHAFEGHAGQPLWIVTTLALETSAIAQLYEQRTEIETDIRQWKSFLKLDEMRSRSDEMILKELAIGCVTYNLVVQVRRLAAARRPIPARRISFTGVWNLLMPMILSPRIRTPENWQHDWELLLKRVLQCTIPNRPHRSYPRTVHRKSSKYPRKKHHHTP